MKDTTPQALHTLSDFGEFVDQRFAGIAALRALANEASLFPRDMSRIVP